jgi:hypothetical protein
MEGPAKTLNALVICLCMVLAASFIVKECGASISPGPSNKLAQSVSDQAAPALNVQHPRQLAEEQIYEDWDYQVTIRLWVNLCAVMAGFVLTVTVLLLRSDQKRSRVYSTTLASLAYDVHNVSCRCRPGINGGRR